MTPKKAFILAAGLGTRMRPITDDLPKPMIEIGGKPLISYALDRLEEIGVEEVVVNTHYKSEPLKNHLKTRSSPIIHISHEEELLNTGGGIKNAIEHFTEPFFVLSGDGFWEDSDQNALKSLAETWDPDKMDILMLLQPVDSMKLTKGVGDYNLSEQGKALRSKNQTGQYMFTSIRINSHEIFKKRSNVAFSYLELMDKAEEQGRLYGLIHDGDWHHISTPADLNSVSSIYHKTKRVAS